MKKMLIMSLCALISAAVYADTDYIQVTNLTERPLWVAIYTHKKGERPVRTTLHEITPGYMAENIVRPALSITEKIKLTDRDLYFAQNPYSLGKDMPSTSSIRQNKQYINVGELKGKQFAIAPATNGTPDVNGAGLVGGPKERIEKQLNESRQAAYQAGTLK